MRELAVWRQQAGLEGGAFNASTEVVEREDENVGALIMGRNMFGGGRGVSPDGMDGGGTTRRFTCQCSCLPTPRVPPSSARAARPLSSLPAARQKRWTGRATRPGERTSRFLAEPGLRGNTLPPDCLTSC